MNFYNDPRVKKLLEKATLEGLMKIYFQRVYGKDEIQEMENALKNALEKYSKNDVMYEVRLYIIIRVFTLHFRNFLRTTKTMLNHWWTNVLILYAR